MGPFVYGNILHVNTMDWNAFIHHGLDGNVFIYEFHIDIAFCILSSLKEAFKIS